GGGDVRIGHVVPGPEGREDVLLLDPGLIACDLDVEVVVERAAHRLAHRERQDAPPGRGFTLLLLASRPAVQGSRQDQDGRGGKTEQTFHGTPKNECRTGRKASYIIGTERGRH